MNVLDVPLVVEMHGSIRILNYMTENDTFGNRMYVKVVGMLQKEYWKTVLLYMRLFRTNFKLLKARYWHLDREQGVVIHFGYWLVIMQNGTR